MEFFFNFKFELTEKKMHSFYLILSFLKTFFVYLKKFKDGDRGKKNDYSFIIPLIFKK